MDAPLFGFAWNQADSAPDYEAGLFTVIARDRYGKFHAVGTGFVVSTAPLEGRALGLTAGHVLEEVGRLQRGSDQTWHPSTLPEFRPPLKPTDLSLQGLAVVATAAGKIAIFEVEGISFDSAADIGLIALRPQAKREERDVPKEFALDPTMPAVGQVVGVASYAGMVCETVENGSFRLTRQPVIRIGRVLNVYPEGQRLCRGPCFETSIPLFSGMSGGPVFHWGNEGPMRVMGLVCCDPDLDGPQKDDRTHEGRSLIAQVPVEVLGPGNDAAQRVQFSFIVSEFVGIFPTLSFGKSQ